MNQEEEKKQSFPKGNDLSRRDKEIIEKVCAKLGFSLQDGIIEDTVRETIKLCSEAHSQRERPNTIEEIVSAVKKKFIYHKPPISVIKYIFDLIHDSRDREVDILLEAHKKEIETLKISHDGWFKRSSEQADFIKAMTESIDKLIKKVDEKRMDVFRNPFYRNAYGWILKELRQTLKSVSRKPKTTTGLFKSSKQSLSGSESDSYHHKEEI